MFAFYCFRNDGLDADGRAVGGARAADRDVSAVAEGAGTKPAPVEERDPMAASEWREVASAGREMGPWWKATQTFIRCPKLGVWKQLLVLVSNWSAPLRMDGFRRRL